ARRTSVINQLRAFLLERGLVFAKSPARVRERMPEILENAEEDLTPRMRNLLALLWNEWKDTLYYFLEIERAKIGHYQNGEPSIMRKLAKYRDYYGSDACEREWGTFRQYRVIVV